jgi:hypothetical protein
MIQPNELLLLEFFFGTGFKGILVELNSFKTTETFSCFSSLFFGFDIFGRLTDNDELHCFYGNISSILNLFLFSMAKIPKTWVL